MENNIIHSKRRPRRPVEIKIKTAGKRPNINIANTYTPGMCYDEDTHRKHWPETREILRQIPLKM